MKNTVNEDFKKWWEETGCRKELSHEERARQGWNASVNFHWDKFLLFAIECFRKVEQNEKRQY